MIDQPKIIDGGIAVDDRGKVGFVNDFAFENVRRFYSVENFSVDTIRAFHGHKKEAKYLLVTSGSALVLLAKLSPTKEPDKDQKPMKFIVSSSKQQILYIPPMYANGFRSLEHNTKLMFFSTSTLKESQENDDFRYPFDYWGKDVWEVENR